MPPRQEGVLFKVTRLGPLGNLSTLPANNEYGRFVEALKASCDVYDLFLEEIGGGERPRRWMLRPLKLLRP